VWSGDPEEEAADWLYNAVRHYNITIICSEKAAEWTPEFGTLVDKFLVYMRQWQEHEPHAAVNDVMWTAQNALDRAGHTIWFDREKEYAQQNRIVVEHIDGVNDKVT